jgi:hypothetical protein
MAKEIRCPQCNTPVSIEEAVAEEYKKELQAKMTDYLARKEEEFRQRQQQLEEQKQLLERSTRQKITEEFSVRLKDLEDDRNRKAAQLAETEKLQLQLMRERSDLEQKQKNFDLELEKRLLEKREQIEKEILRNQEILFDLKMKEKENQMESLKKTIEELKRKTDISSQQSQGEAQELLLEEILRAGFPFDTISEVGKGKRGADCIQIIHNKLGQACGSIIYESKRTKEFSAEWIDKLKADMRSQGADAAVIVTQVLPKDLDRDRFGEKEGVWICSFADVKAVTYMLREGIIKIYNASKSQENKGDKMHLLYDYLTGGEFAEQWKAIREGFLNIKLSIQKERDSMEKLWKAREKQLEKVLLNAAHIRGSVEGIAGSDSVDMNLLEDTETDEEEP